MMPAKDPSQNPFGQEGKEWFCGRVCVFGVGGDGAGTVSAEMSPFSYKTAFSTTEQYT